MSTEALELEQERKPSGMLERFLAKSCDQGPITKDTEGEHLALRNNMQFILALRKFGDTSDHSVVKIWLAKYSIDFGRAFDKVIEEDPLFFDGYQTLDEVPEEKWVKLESIIYTHKS